MKFVLGVKGVLGSLTISWDSDSDSDAELVIIAPE